MRAPGTWQGTRCITRGVDAEIDPEVQDTLWRLIDLLCDRTDVTADYLQVFELASLPADAADGHNQSIAHRQEQPPYRATYSLRAERPYTGRVFVIDDGTHATMLLACEY